MKILSYILLITVFTINGLQAQNTPVVIELFTSQGCSSCPPADDLLQEISETYADDVIVLSYHVDYWDYIGWKDPYASERNTQKQYAYGAQFKTRSVYTPQAIINGDTHFTGSNRSKMIKAIEHYKSVFHTNTSANIGTIKTKKNVVIIQANFENINPDSKKVYVVAVKKKETAVQRGENRNRQLKNTHIVAGMTVIERGHGSDTAEITLASWVRDEDALEVIVYVSNPEGRITTATRRDIHKPSKF
jgi:hypothetical protein